MTTVGDVGDFWLDFVKRLIATLSDFRSPNENNI